MVSIDHTGWYVAVAVTLWFLGLFALCAVVLAARSDDADAARRERRVRRRRAPIDTGSRDDVV